MNVERILVTGQFWEREFADLVKGVGVPTTLLTCDRIEQLEKLEQPFGLVLIAQAGRQTVSQEFVDRLRQMVGAEVPMVNLLGSWCEGQSRSGQPLQNVLPLYWHQWTGGLAQLLQLAAQARGENRLEVYDGNSLRVGVSALVHAQANSLKDALEFFGVEAVWLEQATWQSQPIEKLNAIVVDGDSNTASLHQRLEQLRTDHPDVPVLITLNFPRKDEVLELQAMPQVAGVFSKPFDLSQLGRLLGKATGGVLVKESEVSTQADSSHHRESPQANESRDWQSANAVHET
jgi:DNA-binding NarL/FixJ family response regulator